MWMREQTSERSDNGSFKQWRRILFFTAAGVIFAAGILVGATVYANQYADRVIPGLTVGGVNIGGFSHEELTGWLHAATNRLSGEGIRFTFETTEGQKNFTLYPVSAYEDISQEIVQVDVPREVDFFLGYGKDASVLVNTWRVLRGLIAPVDVRLQTISVDREKVLARIKEEVVPYEQPPRPSTLRVTSVSPVAYEITSSSPGIVFENTMVAEEIISAWSQLIVPEIRLVASKQQPTITEPDITAVQNQIPNVFESGDFFVRYTHSVTGEEREWNVTPALMAAWLTVIKNNGGEMRIAFDDMAVSDWLTDSVASAIDVPAQNARFQIDENGKVSEFQGSRAGISLDVASTTTAIQDALVHRLAGVSVSDGSIVTAVVLESSPEVSTGDVNNLGITDILGVGISRFAGSPANRIKNIKNGAAKINGLLIKPGEEFSTVSSTQPYTIEAGYVPELVIQGNKVEPALGGGLCQISTTLFRMAMNSGLEITERRNHSLLVSYYNDLTNGLPGTDATIFEPKPDFRFKNDTDSYVLIQAEVDEKKSELRLTLWGTSDGRKGGYSAPVVKRWIPYGPTRTTETTTLPPGTTKCQNAYTGAEASFVYTRTMPNGEKIERVFDSYYRPLPKICLIGAEVSTSTLSTPLLTEAENSGPVSPGEAAITDG